MGVFCLSFLYYRLRDSWPAGSYFEISAEFVFSMLQGSCDFGGYQEYEFYRNLQNLEFIYSIYTITSS